MDVLSLIAALSRYASKLRGAEREGGWEKDVLSGMMYGSSSRSHLMWNTKMVCGGRTVLDQEWIGSVATIRKRIGLCRHGGLEFLL